MSLHFLTRHWRRAKSGAESGDGKSLGAGICWPFGNAGSDQYPFVIGRWPTSQFSFWDSARTQRQGCRQPNQCTWIANWLVGPSSLRGSRSAQAEGKAAAKSPCVRPQRGRRRILLGATDCFRVTGRQLQRVGNRLTRDDAKPQDARHAEPRQGRQRSPRRKTEIISAARVASWLARPRQIGQECRQDRLFDFSPAVANQLIAGMLQNHS
jgi:hypothetical protein